MSSQTSTQRAAKAPFALEDAASPATAVEYTRRPRRPFLWFSLEQKKLISKATGVRRTKMAVVKGRKTKRADALSYKVAEAWRSLSPRQRAKYQKKWEEDKVRFERDLANGMVEKPSKNKRDAGKAEAADSDKMQRPKKTMNAYAYFVQQNSERLALTNAAKSGGLRGINVALNKEWKALSAAEKQRYEDQSRADSDRYQREMKEYREMVAAGLDTVVKRPKKYMSAFCRFLQATCQNGRFTAAASKQWQALDAAEKQKYRDAERKDAEQYKQDLKAFKAYQVSVRAYSSVPKAILDNAPKRRWAKPGKAAAKATPDAKKHAKKAPGKPKAFPPC